MNCFDLDLSKSFLPMVKYFPTVDDETFRDSVDQDLTAQNVHSDLRSTLSTILFTIATKLFLHLANELYF